VEIGDDLAQQAFRAEARDWLLSNVPSEPRPTEGPAMRAFDVDWQRIQFEAGWAGISWPTEHGGRGLSVLEQMIWAQEYARAEAPYPGCCYVGLNHGGPTIIVRGSDDQRAKHLPSILRGDETWCQGFSEPNAGSDLAAVRTSGIVDGDHLVVSGQKIWTSYAQYANFQELLVRTDTTSRHKGLTWVICDMASPGIDVRPIKTMARQSPFCEVFYDEVRIPLENVVGAVNDGWSVAMTTFSFERGTGFMAEQVELVRIVERLIERSTAPGAQVGELVRHGLARARADVAALGAMVNMLASRLARSPEASQTGVLLRVFHGELVQRVYALGLEVLGPHRVEFAPWGSQDGWTGSYLRSFSATLGGGTTDIARNIIGERILGLPRTRVE
jgi:alkylation response protein AidB-like acyl-CoA dehydrogenase